MQDYVSRYEWNAYRYPGQYIRLKQENWQKLHHLWSNPEEEPQQIETNQTLSAFEKWKSFIKRESVQEFVEEKDEGLPKTEDELKKYFLDKLFPFQLKWASSTLADVSFIDKNIKNDNKLKYFLQRFPDTYLVLYYPVFSLKNVPIDGEIILISPIGIDIISVVDKQPTAKILAGDERTWITEVNEKQEKVLSPLIALKRTEQIVKRVLATEGIDFPIKKLVLSRNNEIVFHTEPYNTKFIGKREYENWFAEKRKLVSPLKNRQLKALETLLKHCQTTSMKRPEWEEEQSFTMDNNP
ncbi:NERD domain-containing protein [Virgibacillus sp. DJP39]|uniref:NERD domain-containing protein n=1 Tax=Virgibacillus sp. DJP39 TaxID=3409790 RepID=UPI003BB6980B